MQITRRSLLGGIASVAMLPPSATRGVAASSQDARLVIVILRGALDGLSAVVPYGDQQYRKARPTLALGEDQILKLNGVFGLHPELKVLKSLYDQKDALVVHAAATPYRSRSHFSGQDVLENGLEAPGRRDSGWLSRAADHIAEASRVVRTEQASFAAMPAVPLILRGQSPVLTWTPPLLPVADDDTYARLLSLYQHTDPQLLKVLQSGMEADELANGMTASTEGAGKQAGLRKVFYEAAAGTARFLCKSDGPRLAVLSYSGWDTHAREGGVEGNLARTLGALDASFEAFRNEMRDVWRQTAVVVVTEFGRTVSENGTAGTDHGTGTAAFLIGGAVDGGKVVTDWPGLSPGKLYEGRDLMPTIDLRSVFKGVLADHLGYPSTLLAESVFPGSLSAKPLTGLIKG